MSQAYSNPKRPKCVAWADLPDKVRGEVRSAFVHWHHDTTSATFEEWAAKHAFYVTKQGQLAIRPNRCEPVFLADARQGRDDDESEVR